MPTPFPTICPQKTGRPSAFYARLLGAAVALWILPVAATSEAQAPSPEPPSASSPAGLNEIDAAIEACSAIGEAVARARVQQGEAAVDAAAVLPNPDIGFNDNRSLTGPRDHETILGVSVPLGLGGARFVLQDAAAADREAALLGAGQGAFDMALEVRERFARASLAAARLAVLQEQQDAVASLIDRVERLASGGEAAAYDILRLRARRRATRLQAKPLRSALEAERRWLETMVGAEVTIDPQGAERLVASPRPSAKGDHPAIARLEKQAQAERLRARAAGRRWAPDVDVFVGYRTVGGLNQARGHGLSVNLTVPLTLFDHGQGQARRARARAELNEAQAAAARRRFEAQKQRAATREATLGAADDGESAVQMAHRWVDAASKLYQAGEGSLLDVLEAFRARTQAELAELDVLEQRVNARLAAMRASGHLGSPRLETRCGIAREEAR